MSDDQALETHVQAAQHAASHTSVYVYEAPLRLWHWINAAAVMVLSVTGYLIGVPLPTTTGEASEWFVMGYIRFAHFAAAYIFAAGMVFRLYWAVAGNEFARQIFFIPVWSRQWTHELVYQLKWMLFIERTPLRYFGHNPFAHLAMFGMFILPAFFMVVTGFAMYSEATGRDSWQHLLFGWIVSLFTNTQDLHTWHRAGMWVILNFVMIHIYAAVREDIMSGQSVISTMVNGYRLFKDRH